MTQGLTRDHKFESPEGEPATAAKQGGQVVAHVADDAVRRLLEEILVTLQNLPARLREELLNAK